MTKPVTIPNTFATATTAIPLSQLDGDFTAVATAINDANTYSNYAADTGSANAYVVTFSGVSTAYSAGLRIQFKAGNANTGASTINVNAQGAKNITYQDASALASGAIAVNSIVDVMYDGTQFLLMNDPAGATGGDVTGPASATDNAVVRFDGTTGKLVQNSVVTIADSTGNISGVGQLNATTVDTTNLEVTNIKAIDGTAAASIANSTGVVSITANPVLSGGTANGVLYLNGSKVATSGSGLVFDSSGNLGLGVTPSAWGSGQKAIDISTAGGIRGDSSTVGLNQNCYYNGTNWIYRLSTAASKFECSSGVSAWYTAASGSAGNMISFGDAKMTLDASGRLLVGKTSSSSDGKLQVLGGNSYDGNFYTVASFKSIDGSAEKGILLGYNDSDGSGIISPAYANGSDAIAFWTQNGVVWGERARITSDGALLVGTTTAVAQITSVSSSASNAAGYFNVNAASSTAIPAIYGRKYDNNNTTSQIYMSFQYNQGSGGAGGIQGNGATGVQFYSSSDARLKENIVDLESQLQNIMSLKPSKFDYIDGPKNCIGFIAQQIEVVYPDVIGTTTDGYKTIGGISIMETRLIKAIQEQQALIESLTSRVAQLEGTQP